MVPMRGVVCQGDISPVHSVLSLENTHFSSGILPVSQRLLDCVHVSLTPSTPKSLDPRQDLSCQLLLLHMKH